MANGSAYRRGSVFGALLLIAIGGLFLYANLQASFNPWPVIARYWPVLIIFWGLSRLVDYLMLRGRPEAAAATRLGAGDIIGLVFLILLGTAFTHIVNRHGWSGGPIVIGDEQIGCLFGNEFEFTDELHEVAASPGELTLSNLRGDLTLTASDGNEIHIVARKTVCAPSESEAQEVASGFVPLLEARSGGFEFRWDSPRGGTGLLEADLEVRVPRQTALKVSGERGDVRIDGVGARVDLKLDRGDAEVQSIQGDVRVEIRRGDVRIADVQGSAHVEGRGSEVSIRKTAGAATLEGEFYGPIHFSEIAGTARFHSRRTEFTAARIEGAMTIEDGELRLRGVPGDVRLHTRDKEIEMEEVAGTIDVENRNGEVVVRAREPLAYPIKVRNRNGGIDIFLPVASSFQLSATAQRGEIDSSFPGLRREDGEEDRTQVLSGTHGGGRILIELTTVYGTISVRPTG